MLYHANIMAEPDFNNNNNNTGKNNILRDKTLFKTSSLSLSLCV